jgi:hypothetical protein
MNSERFKRNLMAQPKIQGLGDQIELSLFSSFPLPLLSCSSVRIMERAAHLFNSNQLFVFAGFV